MPSIFSDGTSLPSTILNEPDRLIVGCTCLLWGARDGCEESAPNHGALALMQELRWRTVLFIGPWADPANHPSPDK